MGSATSFSTKILRSIAFWTTIIFTSSQIAMSAPALPKNIQSQSSEVSFDHFIDTITLPESIGMITKRVVPSRGAPSVIHIQDAHTSLEAQENIAEVIAYLQKKYNTHLLLIEGATGELEPQNLSFFKEAALDQEVATELVSEGVLGGAGLQLFNDYVTESQITGFGVENFGLYERNFVAYKDIMRNLPEAENFLTAMKADIVTESSSVMNETLYDFFKTWMTHQDQSGDLLRHLNVLREYAGSSLEIDFEEPATQLGWPQLVRIFKLKNLEPELNHQEARAEHLKLTAWAESVSQLRVPGVEIKNVSQSMTPRRALEDFYSQAQEQGFKFQDYPHLTNVWGSQILQSEIQAEKLMVEMNELTEQVLKSLSNNAKEKALIETYQKYLLLKKAFALELTHDEFMKVIENADGYLPSNVKVEGTEKVEGERWKVEGTSGEKIASTLDPQSSTFQVLSSTKALDTLYKKTIAFYQIAKAREKHMLENMIGRMKETKNSNAILVTGGFHTEGLNKLFEEKGMAYLEVMPRMTQVTEDIPYKQLMSGEAKTSQVVFPQGIINARVNQITSAGAAIHRGVEKVLTRVAQKHSRKNPLSPSSQQPTVRSEARAPRALTGPQIADEAIEEFAASLNALEVHHEEVIHELSTLILESQEDAFRRIERTYRNKLSKPKVDSKLSVLKAWGQSYRSDHPKHNPQLRYIYKLASDHGLVDENARIKTSRSETRQRPSSSRTLEQVADGLVLGGIIGVSIVVISVAIHLSSPQSQKDVKPEKAAEQVQEMDDDDELLLPLVTPAADPFKIVLRSETRSLQDDVQETMFKITAYAGATTGAAVYSISLLMGLLGKVVNQMLHRDTPAFDPNSKTDALNLLIETIRLEPLTNNPWAPWVVGLLTLYSVWYFHTESPAFPEEKSASRSETRSLSDEITEQVELAAIRAKEIEARGGDLHPAELFGHVASVLTLLHESLLEDETLRDQIVALIEAQEGQKLINKVVRLIERKSDRHIATLPANQLVIFPAESISLAARRLLKKQLFRYAKAPQKRASELQEIISSFGDFPIEFQEDTESRKADGSLNVDELLRRGSVSETASGLVVVSASDAFEAAHRSETRALWAHSLGLEEIGKYRHDEVSRVVNATNLSYEEVEGVFDQTTSESDWKEQSAKVIAEATRSETRANAQQESPESPTHSVFMNYGEIHKQIRFLIAHARADFPEDLVKFEAVATSAGPALNVQIGDETQLFHQVSGFGFLDGVLYVHHVVTLGSVGDQESDAQKRTVSTLSAFQGASKKRKKKKIIFRESSIESGGMSAEEINTYWADFQTGIDEESSEWPEELISMESVNKQDGRVSLRIQFSEHETTYHSILGIAMSYGNIYIHHRTFQNKPPVLTILTANDEINLAFDTNRRSETRNLQEVSEKMGALFFYRTLSWNGFPASRFLSEGRTIGSMNYPRLSAAEILNKVKELRRKGHNFKFYEDVAREVGHQVNDYIQQDAGESELFLQNIDSIEDPHGLLGIVIENFFNEEGEFQLPPSSNELTLDAALHQAVKSYFQEADKIEILDFDDMDPQSLASLSYALLISGLTQDEARAYLETSWQGRNSKNFSYELAIAEAQIKVQSLGDKFFEATSTEEALQVLDEIKQATLEVFGKRGDEHVTIVVAAYQLFDRMLSEGVVAFNSEEVYKKAEAIHAEIEAARAKADYLPTYTQMLEEDYLFAGPIAQEHTFQFEIEVKRPPLEQHENVYFSVNGMEYIFALDGARHVRQLNESGLSRTLGILSAYDFAVGIYKRRKGDDGLVRVLSPYEKFFVLESFLLAAALLKFNFESGAQHLTSAPIQVTYGDDEIIVRDEQIVPRAEHAIASEPIAGNFRLPYVGTAPQLNIDSEPSFEEVPAGAVRILMLYAFLPLAQDPIQSKEATEFLYQFLMGESGANSQSLKQAALRLGRLAGKYENLPSALENLTIDAGEGQLKINGTLIEDENHLVSVLKDFGIQVSSAGNTYTLSFGGHSVDFFLREDTSNEPSHAPVGFKIGLALLLTQVSDPSMRSETRVHWSTRMFGLDEVNKYRHDEVSRVVREAKRSYAEVREMFLQTTSLEDWTEQSAALITQAKKRDSIVRSRVHWSLSFVGLDEVEKYRHDEISRVTKATSLTYEEVETMFLQTTSKEDWEEQSAAAIAKAANPKSHWATRMFGLDELDRYRYDEVSRVANEASLHYKQVKTTFLQTTSLEDWQRQSAELIAEAKKGDSNTRIKTHWALSFGLEESERYRHDEISRVTKATSLTYEEVERIFVQTISEADWKEQSARVIAEADSRSETRFKKWVFAAAFVASLVLTSLAGGAKKRNVGAGKALVHPTVSFQLEGTRPYLPEKRVNQMSLSDILTLAKYYKLTHVSPASAAFNAKDAQKILSDPETSDKLDSVFYIHLNNRRLVRLIAQNIAREFEEEELPVIHSMSQQELELLANWIPKMDRLKLLDQDDLKTRPLSDEHVVLRALIRATLLGYLRLMGHAEADTAIVDLGRSVEERAAVIHEFAESMGLTHDTGVTPVYDIGDSTYLAGELTKQHEAGKTVTFSDAITELYLRTLVYKKAERLSTRLQASGFLDATPERLNAGQVGYFVEELRRVLTAHAKREITNSEARMLRADLMRKLEADIRDVNNLPERRRSEVRVDSLGILTVEEIQDKISRTPRSFRPGIDFLEIVDEKKRKGGHLHVRMTRDDGLSESREFTSVTNFMTHKNEVYVETLHTLPSGATYRHFIVKRHGVSRVNLDELPLYVQYRFNRIEIEPVLTEEEQKQSSYRFSELHRVTERNGQPLPDSTFELIVFHWENREVAKDRSPVYERKLPGFVSWMQHLNALYFLTFEDEEATYFKADKDEVVTVEVSSVPMEVKNHFDQYYFNKSIAGVPGVTETYLNVSEGSEPQHYFKLGEDERKVMAPDETHRHVYNGTLYIRTKTPEDAVLHFSKFKHLTTSDYTQLPLEVQIALEYLAPRSETRMIEGDEIRVEDFEANHGKLRTVFSKAAEMRHSVQVKTTSEKTLYGQVYALTGTTVLIKNSSGLLGVELPEIRSFTMQSVYQDRGETPVTPAAEIVMMAQKFFSDSTRKTRSETRSNNKLQRVLRSDEISEKITSLDPETRPGIMFLEQTARSQRKAGELRVQVSVKGEAAPETKKFTHVMNFTTYENKLYVLELMPGSGSDFRYARISAEVGVEEGLSLKDFPIPVQMAFGLIHFETMQGKNLGLKQVTKIRGQKVAGDLFKVISFQKDQEGRPRYDLPPEYSLTIEGYVTHQKSEDTYYFLSFSADQGTAVYYEVTAKTFRFVLKQDLPVHVREFFDGYFFQDDVEGVPGVRETIIKFTDGTTKHFFQTDDLVNRFHVEGEKGRTTHEGTLYLRIASPHALQAAADAQADWRSAVGPEPDPQALLRLSDDDQFAFISLEKGFDKGTETDVLPIPVQLELGFLTLRSEVREQGEHETEIARHHPKVEAVADEIRSILQSKSVRFEEPEGARVFSAKKVELIDVADSEHRITIPFQYSDESGNLQLDVLVQTYHGVSFHVESAFFQTLPLATMSPEEVNAELTQYFDRVIEEFDWVRPEGRSETRSLRELFSLYPKDPEDIRSQIETLEYRLGRYEAARADMIAHGRNYSEGIVPIGKRISMTRALEEIRYNQWQIQRLKEKLEVIEGRVTLRSDQAHSESNHRSIIRELMRRYEVGKRSETRKPLTGMHPDTIARQEQLRKFQLETDEKIRLAKAAKLAKLTKASEESKLVSSTRSETRKPLTGMHPDTIARQEQLRKFQLETDEKIRLAKEAKTVKLTAQVPVGYQGEINLEAINARLADLGFHSARVKLDVAEDVAKRTLDLHDHPALLQELLSMMDVSGNKQLFMKAKRAATEILKAAGVGEWDLFDPTPKTIILPLSNDVFSKNDLAFITSLLINPGDGATFVASDEAAQRLLGQEGKADVSARSETRRQTPEQLQAAFKNVLTQMGLPAKLAKRLTLEVHSGGGEELLIKATQRVVGSRTEGIRGVASNQDSFLKRLTHQKATHLLKTPAALTLRGRALATYLYLQTQADTLDRQYEVINIEQWLHENGMTVGKINGLAAQIASLTAQLHIATSA